jgi:hypothetical protein
MACPRRSVGNAIHGRGKAAAWYLKEASPGILKPRPGGKAETRTYLRIV